MFKIIFEFLPFLISSGITFYLLYKNTPITTLQQINSVLLIVLLVLFSMIAKINSHVRIMAAYRVLMATFLSLFAQLLIFSTGGFFSPFLIVLHLLTIALSFILNFGSSISFLLLSVVLLISSIVLVPNNALLFRQDPFSVVLYGISFVVIIPLIQFISKTYHLNEVLYKKVAGYLRISSGREHSLLKGLRDLVVITDEKLNVVSLNETASTVLELSAAEYQTKTLGEVLRLVDQNKQPISENELSVRAILEDKTTRIIENFYCLLPSQKEPVRVKIQISPVLDDSQSVAQLVFLLTEAPNIDVDKLFSITAVAVKKLEPLYAEIKHLAYEQKQDAFNQKIEILKKITEDIVLVQEINSPMNLMAYVDTAQVAKNSLENVRLLAVGLHVATHFSIESEQTGEEAYQHLAEVNSAATIGLVSPYSLTVNRRCLEILTQKLMEMAVFIASNKAGGRVNVSIKSINEPKHLITLTIQADSTNLSAQELGNLLMINFPGLVERTNLSLGSGLEGMIAKSVATQLGLVVDLGFNVYNSQLIMTVNLVEKSAHLLHFKK